MDTVEAVRDRIKSSANGLFYEHGFERTTVREIARESSVSLGGIYIYFASKEDILYALLLDAHDGLDAEISAALAACGLDPVDRLFTFIEAFVYRHTRLPRHARVANREFYQLAPTRYAEIVGRRRATREQLVSLMKDVCDSGVRDIKELPVPDAASSMRLSLAATMITSAAVQVSEWYRPSGALSAHEVARTYAIFTLQFVGHGDISDYLGKRKLSEDG